MAIIPLDILDPSPGIRNVLVLGPRFTGRLMAAPIRCVRFGGLEKILTSGITGRGEKIMGHKFEKTWLIII